MNVERADILGRVCAVRSIFLCLAMPRLVVRRSMPVNWCALR